MTSSKHSAENAFLPISQPFTERLRRQDRENSGTPADRPVTFGKQSAKLNACNCTLSAIVDLAGRRAS
ncbi:MAG: hypothetical protein ACRC62_33730 [Microcoleus sp.]